MFGDPCTPIFFVSWPPLQRGKFKGVLGRLRCGLLLCILALAGCSGHVEFRKERSASPSRPPSAGSKATGSERSGAEVEFGVFQKPRPETRKTSEPSPSAAKPEPAPQVIVVNVVRDESQHVVHIHAPPERRRETVWMRFEVEKETPADDPQCLEAMRAHQERVRRWAEEFRRR